MRGNNRGRNNYNNNNNNRNNQNHQNSQNNGNYNNNNNNANNSNRGGLISLSVRGWRNSNAASNPDGGVSSLSGWLEKKASRKIVKSHTQGDALIIQVDQNAADRFLHLNGFTFANANITVENSSNQNNNTNNNNTQQNNQQNNQNNHNNQTNQNQNNRQNQQNSRNGNSMQVENANAAEVEAVERALVAVIQRCYNPGLKHLALDSLPKQAEFIATGLTTQPASKVFSAIFVCCETKVFETPLKRQQMVENLSLRDNGLTTVKDCIAAAGTFNTIKGLDLSMNQIKDIGELRYWRNRFPNLEHLLLEGNPVDGPETLKKMRQWYPKLNQYNGKSLEALQQEIPQPVQVPLAAIELLPNREHPELAPGSDFGQPAPGKPGDQLMKEQMVLRFSYETRLKLELSTQALMGNNWEYDAAKKNLLALIAQGAIQETDAFMWGPRPAN